MAPSRNIVRALLGIVVSIQAFPAAFPEPEAQFSLIPPHYSISWDPPLPVATDEPEDLEEPEQPDFPSPKPSNQISLGPPSATISWDGGPVPAYPPVPTDPEEPKDPVEPQPSTTNIISLNPPSYSVSWNGPNPPETTGDSWQPWPPRPSHKNLSDAPRDTTVQ